MQRFRKGKKGMQAVVLLFIFSLLIAGFSTNSMVSKAAAKGKKIVAIKTVSLKIGKKKVTKKTYKMKLGEKKKLKVRVSPKKEKKTIQFSSSNKKVVTVNKSGLLTAKKTGSAKIKVTVKKGISKKKGRMSKKKTTWVKIKVVKATIPKDKLDSDTEPPVDQNTVKGKKSLVVYFSCTDTTKKIAEYVQQSTGADIYRIEAAVPYSAEDLNYGNADSRTSKEQNNPMARPAIAGYLPGLDGYEIVYLGYPLWFGQAPKIMYTFVENYNLNGKTVIPFCTSHSSGIGTSATNLQTVTKGNATWIAGQRFSGSSFRADIEKWINNLDLTNTTSPTGTTLVTPKPEEPTPPPSETPIPGETLPPSESETPKPLVTPEPRVFDFGTKTVTLNSGYRMPLNGIGTYSLTGDTCVNSVSEALKRGVRLIDTAYMYHNEAEVGEAVRNSGIPRSEIFVITKLYPNQFSEPEKAINDALEKLNIGYIDMMILHHPGTNDVKAYKAMEKAVGEGKIRSIGLSNWYVEELEEFLPQVTITPAVVQNEIHPYYQENDVIPYIQKLGIVVQGWYPLGGRGHTAELLGDETISAIAKVHGKSSAQVILRWNLQKGVVVIPGSSNPEHIQENTELYDFELSDEEMEKINALDRNEKHDWY